VSCYIVNTLKNTLKTWWEHEENSKIPKSMGSPPPPPHPSKGEKLGPHLHAIFIPKVV